jgi:hypothetical protein
MTEYDRTSGNDARKGTEMKPTKKQMALMDAMAQDREIVHYVDCGGLEAMKGGFCNTEIKDWAKVAGLSTKSARGVFASLVKAGWVELDGDNFRNNPSFTDYWDMSAFTQAGIQAYEIGGGGWYEAIYKERAARYRGEIA